MSSNSLRQGYYGDAFDSLGANQNAYLKDGPVEDAITYGDVIGSVTPLPVGWKAKVAGSIAENALNSTILSRAKDYPTNEAFTALSWQEKLAMLAKMGISMGRPGAGQLSTPTAMAKAAYDPAVNYVTQLFE